MQNVKIEHSSKCKDWTFIPFSRLFNVTWPNNVISFKSNGKMVHETSSEHGQRHLGHNSLAIHNTITAWCIHAWLIVCFDITVIVFCQCEIPVQSSQWKGSVNDRVFPIWSHTIFPIFVQPIKIQQWIVQCTTCQPRLVTMFKLMESESIPQDSKSSFHDSKWTLNVFSHWFQPFRETNAVMWSCMVVRWNGAWPWQVAIVTNKPHTFANHFNGFIVLVSFKWLKFKIVRHNSSINFANEFIKQNMSFVVSCAWVTSGSPNCATCVIHSDIVCACWDIWLVTFV